MIFFSWPSFLTLAGLVDVESGQRSKLLGKGFSQMGVGVAFERTPEGFRVVWVQCLARPASMPTTADSSRDSE